MDPISLMAASTLGAGILGAGASIYGANQASAQQAAAEEAALKQQQAIMAQLQAIGVPSVQAQQIALKQYPTPTQLAQSQLQNVNYNPQQQAIQQQALAKLQDISNQGGMDAQARAGLQAAMDQTSLQEQGNRQALEQAAQRRGMANSGMSMVQQQMGAQNAANQNRSIAAQQAAQAQQRGLQALAQGTSLSQSMGNRDLDLQSQKAQAADRINQFNTQQANTAAQQNTALQNQQEMYNKGLVQQNYQNQLSKVTGQQPTANNMANILAQSGQQQAANTAAQYQALGGLFNAAGQAGSQYGSNELDSQRWNKLFNAKYPTATPAPSTLGGR